MHIVIVSVTARNENSGTAIIEFGSDVVVEAEYEPLPAKSARKK